MRRIRTRSVSWVKLNTLKISFLKDKEAPKLNVTVKRLVHIHMDMEHADHTQMVMECNKLGCKMGKSMDLKISRVIQECITCRHKDKVFTKGKGNKYKSGFNTDVLVHHSEVCEHEEV